MDVVSLILLLVYHPNVVSVHFHPYMLSHSLIFLNVFLSFFEMRSGNHTNYSMRIHVHV